MTRFSLAAVATRSVSSLYAEECARIDTPSALSVLHDIEQCQPMALYGTQHMLHR
jgi:hypothetical protein